MKKEIKDSQSARRTEKEGEWSGEHERRKQNWSERERRQRKERRHPESSEFDEMLAPQFGRRMLS